MKVRNRLEHHDQGIASISFSPDGKTITSASWDGAIKSWNLVEKKLPKIREHKKVTSISFNNDGTMLASSSYDGKVMLWDLDSDKPPQIIAETKEYVRSVSFSPKGKIIAFAMEYDDKETKKNKGKIKFWDIDKNEERLEEIDNNQQGVRGISFSPNEKTIASAGTDGTIKLWNINTKQLENTLGSPKSKSDTSPFQSISFSPTDDKTIVSADDDGIIKLWDVGSKKSVQLGSHKPGIISISFSPQGKYIASTGEDETIKLWSTNGTLINTLRGHQGAVYEVSFNRIDNNMLASSSADKSVKIWNLDKLPQKLLEHNKKKVFSISFSPNNQLLASGSEDGKIRIWNIAEQKTFNNKIPPETITHSKTNEVLSVNFNPNNQLLASGSQDGTIKLWHLDEQGLINEEPKTLEHNKQCSPEEECGVNSVIFDSSGECQLIVSGSDNGTVKIWDTNGEEKQFLEVPNSKSLVYDVSLSSDCQYIASAHADGNVRFWKREGDLFKFPKILSPKHKEEVLKVRFSPDNQHIASASGDGTIKIWNSNEGNLVNTLDGHDSREVFALSFSANGQFLASGSKDGKIKIWEINNNKLLRTISGHERGIWSIDFSENGNFIASASEDGTVKLWTNDSLEWQGLNLDKLLNKSCMWLGDYLDYLEYKPNAEKERWFCE